MVRGDLIGSKELVSTTRMSLSDSSDSGSAIVRQSWVRFLNAIASFVAGRRYIAGDGDVCQALIDTLKLQMENIGDETGNLGKRYTANISVRVYVCVCACACVCVRVCKREITKCRKSN